MHAEVYTVYDCVWSVSASVHLMTGSGEAVVRLQPYILFKWIFIASEVLHSLA